MKKYKYVFILIGLFFLSNNAYSQKKSKEITIRYFSELTGDDIVTLEKINNEFFRKKNDKNKTIKLVNLYTNKTMLLSKQSDFSEKIKSYNTPINNVSYSKDNILIEKIKALNLSHLISYKTDPNTEGEFGHLYSDLNELLQVIKKDKESSFNLIYENGFVLYQYSLENFKLVYQAYKENNELSELIPNIIHPYLTEQLRPVGDGYLIEFDSVGWFSEYEIEINSTSDRNKGAFVKERLKFSQNYEEITAISTVPVMYYSGDNRRCYIYIPAELLAVMCVKLNNSPVLNLNEVPSKESCRECGDICLYSTRFEMRLRGYGNGYNKADLWSDYISRFSFQCSRKL